MDKNKMQAQELDQVSGGNYVDNIALKNCPNCSIKYSYDLNYPEGFFLKSKSHGCTSVTYYYKCPGCGYEWTR